MQRGHGVSARAAPRRGPRATTQARRRALAAWTAATTLMLVLAACTGARNDASPTPAKPSGPCELSALAVPSCGVLWGIATNPPTPSRVDAAERAIGRQVDFVYRYHDINDVVPDAAERAWVAQGKLLHIAIAARDFSSAGRGDITWAQIAAGRYDASLLRQARGIASLHVPVFLTFDQEANQAKKVAARGAPDQFVAAWRHVHELYARAGAGNAVWTWVMSGSPGNLVRAAQLWPGNRYVDWISWNVYNQSGCGGNQISLGKYASFENRMLIFYRWLKADGPGLHIDTSKPIMISETGSAQYADAPQVTADWYAAIPPVLEQYPQIKAVGLWDSTDNYCDYDFTDRPRISVGVRRASRNPYLALHGALTLTS